MMCSHQCLGLLLFSEYRERLGSEQSQLFCLRVMVGVIILYDHVHPAGAFARKAAVDVRQ